MQSSKPNPSNRNPLPEKFDFLNPCYLHGFLIYLWLFTLFWCFHHFTFHLKKTWLTNKHLDEIPVNLWWLMYTHFISSKLLELRTYFSLFTLFIFGVTAWNGYNRSSHVWRQYKTGKYAIILFLRLSFVNWLDFFVRCRQSFSLMSWLNQPKW